MAEILYGKPVAEAITESIRHRSIVLKEAGVNPSLAILRVGEMGSQIAYEESARNRCQALGIFAESFHFPDTIGEQELLYTIHIINRDPSIHGCILLLPLPPHLDSRKICNAIDPFKDVDGVTGDSISAMFLGRNGFSPCAPDACIELLDHSGISLRGKRVCVVGRSLVVGRPLAMLLLARDATVTVCHSRTAELAEECRRADILISAAGSPGLIRREHVRSGQILLDVGINVDRNGKLCGDMETNEVAEVVSGVTPVPGGIGLIAGAVLAKHVIQAAEQHLARQPGSPSLK